MKTNNATKVFPDFETELKEIDPRLSIIRNPNYPQLANIKIDGVDICPIPSGEIFDNPDPAYRFIAPNGWELKHKSKSEAVSLVKDTIEKLKNPDFANIFFNRE